MLQFVLHSVSLHGLLGGFAAASQAEASFDSLARGGALRIVIASHGRIVLLDVAQFFLFEVGSIPVQASIEFILVTLVSLFVGKPDLQFPLLSLYSSLKYIGVLVVVFILALSSNHII